MRKNALVGIASGDDGEHILLTTGKHWHFAWFAALATADIHHELTQGIGVDLFDEHAPQLVLAQAHRLLKAQQGLPVRRLKLAIPCHRMARAGNALPRASGQGHVLGQMMILKEEPQRRADGFERGGTLRASMLFLLQVAADEFIGARPELRQVLDLLGLTNPVEKAQNLILIARPRFMTVIFARRRRPQLLSTRCRLCTHRLLLAIAFLANAAERIEMV